MMQKLPIGLVKFDTEPIARLIDVGVEFQAIREFPKLWPLYRGRYSTIAYNYATCSIPDGSGTLATQRQIGVFVICCDRHREMLHPYSFRAIHLRQRIRHVIRMRSNSSRYCSPPTALKHSRPLPKPPPLQISHSLLACRSSFLVSLIFGLRMTWVIRLRDKLIKLRIFKRRLLCPCDGIKHGDLSRSRVLRDLQQHLLLCGQRLRRRGIADLTHRASCRWRMRRANTMQHRRTLRGFQYSLAPTAAACCQPCAKEALEKRTQPRAWICGVVVRDQQCTRSENCCRRRGNPQPAPNWN